MRKRPALATLFVLFASWLPASSTTPAGFRAAPTAGRLPPSRWSQSPAAVRLGVDLVVAQDGSGDYRTVQAALDAVPNDNKTGRIILVKNGTYAEKVFVNAPHVALVGEDRDKTRIVYAELRRNWRATHDDDWGAAVVNIGDDVTDLVLANLTVRNNFGSLHGDHDHQFAIRSGGHSTRIVLLHANVVADGGDTLSLWNAESGMWYHANCYFEGWVDYVCPRGWCYITDSRFFGHNMTASIWHDGSKDPDQKFVIRRSSFDGEAGFPLGRNNRDGQFYLLDCDFSANMADRPIYQPSPPDSYRWPARYYYDNCHRHGGDFAWFADNLVAAKGSPRADDITAAWTFGGRWDPEGTMPAALAFAAVPRPRMGEPHVSAAGVTLRWLPARRARAHRVHVGTETPPPFVAECTRPEFATGPLRPGMTYYWRVDEVTPDGTVGGAVWEFRTETLGIRASESRSVRTSERSNVISWQQSLDQPAEWYRSAEAVRIADNVLAYQRTSGGWPKNVDMARILTPAERAGIIDEKDQNDSTIDNQSTYTQIRYLARTFAAAHLDRFRVGAIAGLDYLLVAQYPNGGWPQFYPLRPNYSRHITFNDDAMIGVMGLLSDVAAGRASFDWVDAARRRRAARAVTRGVEAILAAQVRVNGRLTAWCAQHDERTLAPAAARSYEHPSLSGRETVGIVEFLMAIERPDQRVIAAVEGAVAWLRSVRLSGIRVVRAAPPVPGDPDDAVVQQDANAEPVWARFYEIGTNRPIFSGRDGVVRYRLSEIEYERRANYRWYGSWPAELLDRKYQGWKVKFLS